MRGAYSVFPAHPNDPVATFTLLVQRLMNITSEYPWFPPPRLREVISESPCSNSALKSAWATCIKSLYIHALSDGKPKGD